MTQKTVIWFCGLPGSGKTTISKLVKKALRKKGFEAVYLSMDELRSNLFPKPTYADEERDLAYRALVLLASTLCWNGHNVIVDATAHKKKWRDLARKSCRNFIEVYIKCPIEICIRRETRRRGQNLVRKRLYLDALRRLKSGRKIEGLGKIPGVDEDFEESPNAELVVDSSRGKSSDLSKMVVTGLSKLKDVRSLNSIGIASHARNTEDTRRIMERSASQSSRRVDHKSRDSVI